MQRIPIALLVVSLAALTALAEEAPVLRVLVVSEGFETPLAGIAVRVEDAAGRLHRASTDAEGRVDLKGLAPGIAEVDAAGDGWVARWVLEERVPVSGAHEVRLRMQKAVSLAGVVRSAVTGLPVAGAAVTAVAGGRLHEDRGWSTSSRGEYDHVVTDAKGRFTFRALPDGEVCTLAVLASGFAYQARGIEPRAGSEGVEFALLPGGRLRGRVVAHDGTPVEGATVHAAPEDEKYLARNPAGGRIGRRLVSLPGRTDTSGQFEVLGLAFDRRWVAVAGARGHVPSEVVGGILVAPDSDVAFIEFTLREAARLVVMVTDAEGSPLPSAQIHTGGVYARGRERVAGSDGRAVLEGLSPGKKRLRVTCEGYVPRTVSATVAAGMRNEMEVRLAALQSPVSVSGVAVDDRGQALPDLEILASSPALPGVVRVRTDAEGRFHATGLQPGKVNLAAWAKGYDRVRLLVTAPAEDVELVLPRGSMVKGRVVLGEGVTPPPYFIAYSEALDGTHAGGGTSHPWSEGGAFDFPIRPGVRTRIQIGAATFAPWEAEVEVARGTVHDLGTIRVERGHRLAGILVDADQAPVANANLEVELSLLIGRRATTDPAGCFRLDHLPAGKHEVKVMVAGRDEERHAVEVEATRDDVRLTLRDRAGG